MSSLSQQLKAIGEKNASVALDRKSRAKIHSRSLIFDSKAAAAQDYDYIYQIACEGLEELVSIDPRFARFEATLFSPASVNFDRNTSAKDVVSQAERTALAFVNLAAPYFALSPALKALEWLVRRYHINIHHPETLLLAALPYHNQPVFTRFMSVVPKSSWPAIFSPILGYKDSMKPPPSSSLLKCFHSDPAFFRLYTQYVMDALKNQTVYKEQLVFYVANATQVLASHSRDVARLNDTYIPIVLEASIEFFQDHTFRYSATLAQDTRLSIYTIISVMCALVPLRQELVFTLTKSVLSGKLAFSPALRRPSLILLGQLWHYYNEDDLPSDADVFSPLSIPDLLHEQDLLQSLLSENYKLSKFLFFYFADRVNNSQPEAVKVLALLDPSRPDFLFEPTAVKLLQLLETSLADAVKPTATVVFEKLIKANKNSIIALLDTRHSTLGDMESILSRTLGDSDVNEDIYESNYDTLDLDVIDNDSNTPSFVEYKSGTASFLCSASSTEFFSLLQVLLSKMHGVEVSGQISIVFAFTRVVMKDKLETQCSFLVRVALSPAVPANVRLVALKVLKTKLKNAHSKNLNYAFYLLIPILLLGFSDNNKTIKDYFLSLLEDVKHLTDELVQGKGKKVKCDLFMESQIYGEVDAAQRSIISPQDAYSMLQAVFEHRAQLSDVLVDSSKIGHFIFEVLFKASKSGHKKFGSVLLRAFVLSQWSLPFWPVALKFRAWKIVSVRNTASNGSDDRFVFAEDFKSFFQNIPQWKREAAADNISLDILMSAIVGLVGGSTSSEKNVAKEVDWLVTAISSDPALQVAANRRMITLFADLPSEEFQLKICSELVDLIVKDNDIELEFDPLETLQALNFTSHNMINLLGTVNIVTQIPEQGVAKRRRRSSSSTQKNMARDDISSMAALHLKKLSVIMDVLEAQLRHRPTDLTSPELLQAMFKILTDLDYLCNDGKMPVLYVQETLATCMLLAIVCMKNTMAQKKFQLDSNSIRADLIVNSIRSSQSPQVQNRFLLVIAELASLAPEIILHSVMPIFTFMGAQTIRQDDEFSSSALQQTIAKVVPAITSASASVNNEIEFLLTSFITAFQHIPRHRRVKLFVSLVKTLGSRQSLSTIMFLIGQQFASNLSKRRTHECDSLLDFITSLLKTFSAEECMAGIEGFFDLWQNIPDHALEKDSDEYISLSSRSIYGTPVVTLNGKELLLLKERLLVFLNQALAADEDTTFANSITLKMKVALVLFDDESSQHSKDEVLGSSNKLTSFVLSTLETYTSTQTGAEDLIEQLYGLLKSLLNLLPLSYYISSIIKSLKEATDPNSVNIAKNFAILAGQRFSNEISGNTLDDQIDTVVTEDLLPVLVSRVENFDNIELVQAYLDTFAIIVNKFGTAGPEFSSANNAKFLINSLKVLTSSNGLLNEHVEIVVSSLNAITSIVNCLGVKCIGYFPKILPPALDIWETTSETNTKPKSFRSQEGGNEEPDTSDTSDEEDMEEDQEEVERRTLLQGAILMLFSCLIKKMPAFVISSLIPMIRSILMSEYVDSSIRAAVLDLIVEHVDSAQALQALCNLAINEKIYGLENATSLGLYLKSTSNAIEHCDKRAATLQSTLFMQWLIKSFEFRSEYGEGKLSENTIHSIEGSFYECGLKYVMKLNDKNFRPLFASLVRWAVSGESAGSTTIEKEVRLVSFLRFFNKLQDNLRSIITSYFSYLLDPTVELLQDFRNGKLVNVNLRRILLHSLASSFKYDQDDYWTHQSRFDSIMEPLVGQLENIEDSIGKHLVKAISFFVSNVSSDEHNEKLVNAFIRYISNEYENSSRTKIWTIRVLRTVLQKLGEQWLSYLPTFIPYIAELLEDDDEDVEMEVRKDLVRVIEGILGEPLDRYLS